MKILLIGATGVIGKVLQAQLVTHEVIAVGFSQGDYQTDIEDRTSLERLFKSIGKVDAIISASGNVHFAPIEELGFEQIQASVASKLLGNINVFQIGKQYLNAGGSITLTSGVLAQQPMLSGAAASLINAALESFVKAAAFELGDKLRINTVSPHFVKETMQLMGMDSTDGISAADTAKAYVHAINSNQSGQTFDVAKFV